MSTLTVTSINTTNATTDLTLSTGNTSSGRVVVRSGEGLSLSANSTQNSIIINASATFVVANLTFSAPYRLTTTTLSAGNNHNINCASGNYFVVVANSSSQNVYFTNAPTGVVYACTLRFSNGAGGNTISWANTPRWPGGSTAAPTPSTNNDIWIFITDDGGANWRGTLAQRDSR